MPKVIEKPMRYFGKYVIKITLLTGKDWHVILILTNLTPKYGIAVKDKVYMK